MQRFVKYLIGALASGFLLFAGWLLLRIFVCDQFIVPSESMLPTLVAGDRILVNKWIAGARIYKKFEFAQGVPLQSFRLPGIRSVTVNDVVAFNAPHGYDRNRIEFRINYVYSKRCIGTPGDSVSIRNGYFHNHRHRGSIGNFAQQQRLSKTPDSLIHPKVLRAMPFDDRHFGWTIKNMGPIYVPKADDTIVLDSLNFKLYKQVIEYETSSILKYRQGLFLLNGILISKYTFCTDYYFFCGDNVSDSKDSRYWGFVPEEFIIGVVKYVTYSKDSFTDEQRSARQWKRVE